MYSSFRSKKGAKKVNNIGGHKMYTRGQMVLIGNVGRKAIRFSKNQRNAM